MRSRIPVFKRDELKKFFSTCVLDEYIDTVIDSLSQSRHSKGFFDIQYRPILEVDGRYVVPMNILGFSNVFRNLLQSTESRIVWPSDKDPVQVALGAALAEAGFRTEVAVCASSQEREFLKAVRQYLPNLQAYPNVPLLNFIDIDRMGDILTDRMKSYVRASRVDVLLCTDDEDPVGGIELDSVHHDSDESRERDILKNEFFNLSGLPLIRIRPENSRDVRAEDFYDPLVSEAESLQALRPRRMRPHRNHDFLVPAESACKVRCQS